MAASSSRIAPQFLATGGIDPSDGLLTFQSINLDKVEISGAELGGSLDFGALDERFRGFSLRAAIAWAEGEDETTGAAIDSVEPLTAVLGLGFESPGERWGAELIWSGAGDKAIEDIDPASGRMPTAGYGVLHLLAHVDVGERVQLNAGLFNLLDKTYIRWADTAGMGVDSPARFTQPGFNAGATLRVVW
jgi:hemoglobin/transferrin/lactoferrin receptor protein